MDSLPLRVPRSRRGRRATTSVDHSEKLRRLRLTIQKNLLVLHVIIGLNKRWMLAQLDLVLNLAGH